LPPGVDPFGENGEFHSFVYDGPGFDAPLKFETDEKVLRESFYFCDLVPILKVLTVPEVEKFSVFPSPLVGED
jgi:diphthamide synthase (EF-2-diphthine--ammonia ligase)